MTYQDKLDLIAPGTYQYIGKEGGRATRSVLKDLRYGVIFTYSTGSFLLNFRKDPARVFWNPTRGNVVSVPEGEDAFRLEAQLRINATGNEHLRVLSVEKREVLLEDSDTGGRATYTDLKSLVGNLGRGVGVHIRNIEEEARAALEELAPGRFSLVKVEESVCIKGGKPQTYVTIRESVEGYVFRHKLSYIRARLQDNPQQQFGRPNSEVTKTREETNLKRFGARYPLQEAETLKRLQATLKERYGVENASQLPGYQEKFKATSVERYGVEHPMRSPVIRQRAIDSSKAKHGGVHHTADPKVKRKREETSLKKYGHRSPLGSPEVQKKIIESNLKKYGVDNPQKNPAIRAKTRATNVAKGTTVLHDGKTISEIAGDIGSGRGFVRRLITRIGYEQAKPLLYSYTPGGSSLTAAVVSMFPDFNLIVDKKLPGTKMRPDLLFPDQKVIVEADGLYWHSEASANEHWHPTRSYHMNKLRAYEEQGYRALFFRSDEILDKPEIVSSIIKNALRVNSTRVFARKCEVRKITPNIFTACHLMGAGSGRCYGLVYKNDIVAGIQVKWVNKADLRLDVSRFVTDSGVTVVGGWSRLIAAAIRQEHPRIVQTFIDRRYGTGFHLPAMGWKKRSEHPSFKWTDGVKTWGRMSFPGSSGVSKGLSRIWDCGQAKWEYIVE